MVTMKEMTDEFQVMPSKLSIVAFNTLDGSAIVNGRLGDNIDETLITTYFWFRSQKVFKRVTIRDMNGISVTFETISKLTIVAKLQVDSECNVCGGTGRDLTYPDKPCPKCRLGGS